MSTQYKPLKKRGVAKTPWSHKDGVFDANVDGGQWLGKVHAYLALPIASDASRSSPRVPWCATAAQVKAWAARLTTMFKTLRLSESYNVDVGYLVAWRDFLKTCGGYDSY